MAAQTGAKLRSSLWVPRHPQKFEKPLLETNFYHDCRLNFHIYKRRAPPTIFLQLRHWSQVKINNGESCILWMDKWLDETLRNKYPELFSFAKNPLISVNKAKQQDQLTQLFHLPLTEIAFLQIQSLLTTMRNLQLNDDKDVLGYTWGSDIFASSKIYRLMVTNKFMLHSNGRGRYSVNPSTRCSFGYCSRKSLVQETS